jgi:hypothetical protein
MPTERLLDDAVIEIERLRYVRTCSLCGADESEQTPCLPEDDIVRRLIGVSVSLGLEWTPEYRQNVFDTCREAAKAIKQLRRRGAV